MVENSVLIEADRQAPFESGKEEAPDPAGSLYRIRARFLKTGDAIYLSHLDLARLMQRALARAGLPVAFTQGFNPHPRLVFAAALAVGTESRAEYADFFLHHPVGPEEFQSRLNETLPAGVQILEARSVSLSAPALTGLTRAADYLILLSAEVRAAELAAFLEQEEVLLAREGKATNIRPLILAAEVVRGGLAAAVAVGDWKGGEASPTRDVEEGREVFLRLRTGSQGNLRPEDFFAAFNFFAGKHLEVLWIRRTELWMEKRGQLASLWD